MKLSYASRAVISLIVHTVIVVIGITMVWLLAAFNRDRESLIIAIGMTAAGLLFVLYYTIVAVRAMLSTREPRDDVRSLNVVDEPN
jgi:hypothetical protein